MSKQSLRGSSRTIILLVLVAAIAVAGILWWKTQHKASSSEAVTIRVAYAPVVLNLPSYVAQDRGMFAAKNVSTNFTVFNTANDMINAVVAGQVDAVTGVSLVPILHLEDQYPGKVRVFLHSKMTDACPYDGILVKAESSIKSITDLPGHKVGLFPGTTALNLMKGFLKKHGVSMDKIEFVQLPPPSHLSALESGAVDALLAYEPTLTTALSKGNRRVFGSIYVDLLSPSPISASIISRDFERKHPDAAKAFVAVLDQSIGVIRSTPKEARLSLGNYTKLPPEVIPAVNIVDDVLSTELNTTNLQAFIDLLVQIGELPKPVSAADLIKP
jgi:ABC-type nitrate/sulfonate/bicarbonate transport system substrate-binding protein